MLCNDFISYEEIHTLEKISFLLERYHESGNFDKCLDFVLSKVKSPFDFYMAFSHFIDENDGREIQKISQADAFSLIYAYAKQFLDEVDEKTFSNLMHEDFARREVRKMPRLI